MHSALPLPTPTGWFDREAVCSGPVAAGRCWERLRPAGVVGGATGRRGRPLARTAPLRSGPVLAGAGEPAHRLARGIPGRWQTRLFAAQSRCWVLKGRRSSGSAPGIPWPSPQPGRLTPIKFDTPSAGPESDQLGQGKRGQGGAVRLDGDDRGRPAGRSGRAEPRVRGIHEAAAAPRARSETTCPAAAKGGVASVPRRTGGGVRGTSAGYRGPGSASKHQLGFDRRNWGGSRGRRLLRGSEPTSTLNSAASPEPTSPVRRRQSVDCQGETGGQGHGPWRRWRLRSQRL